jgi:hypothetical protein
VILFHGTSASRATLIREYGFDYPNFELEIEVISQRYEVEAETLKEQLNKLGRIVTSRNDDRKIYFSSHFLHAASYATRAPEFYWEALWAIHVIRNPQLGNQWNQSDEGHVWVLSQMQFDPPVVLHVEVSDHELGQDAERMNKYCAIMPPDSQSGGAEVGLYPSPNLQIVDQTTGDYWIDGSLLRHLTGLSPEEFSRQVDDGTWGEPFSYQVAKYWLWQDIKSRLDSERLRELDLI